MQEWISHLYHLIPAGVSAALSLLILLGMNWFIKKRAQNASNDTTVSFQFLRLIFLALSLIAVVLLLPISEQTQGQVLSLLGVVITAVIALSSTTFVANLMAGLMLQGTNSIRSGDFIRVQNEFGRVIRRNLLQTQIQTEMRDLTTLPNILLINNPVTVLHRDGTIISADISLGYDIPYTQVEELLSQAARESGLEDPFVLVQELLDHAVAYRVAGFLSETKNLLTARSKLRKKSLELLHSHGLEIVSPRIMNSRPLAADHKIIPINPVREQPSRNESASEAPEDRIFDKAEEAANLQQMQLELEEIAALLKELRETAKNAEDSELAALHARIETARQREDSLLEALQSAQSKDKDKPKEG